MMQGPHFEKQSSLQVALLANGTFSGISGFSLIMLSNAIAATLGVEKYVPNWIFLFVGANLAAYGAILYLLAMLKPIPRGWIVIVIGLDVGWVVGSAVLLAISHKYFSQSGVLAIILVASLVGVFAYWQWKLLSQSR